MTSPFSYQAMMRNAQNNPIKRTIGGAINRYRTAQQQAQQAAQQAADPATNDWIMGQMNNANNPPGTAPADPSQPTGYADEVGGEGQISNGQYSQSPQTSSYANMTDGGQGAAMADSSDAFSAPMGGMGDIPAFGGGTIVTKPQLALVGEKGPEMIAPLSPTVGPKVSSAMLGQGLGQRTRFRHLTGPNASARYRPETADLPIRPGLVTR